jgi:hypothetical protein
MSGAPNRLAVVLTPSGPAYVVRPIDRTEDDIWDAVRAAIHSGWSPEHFLRAVREVWASTLDEDKAAAMQALR